MLLYQLYEVAEVDINYKLIEHTFWGALFHDLPEAATRDIVKPVKEQIRDETIKSVEDQLFRKILSSISSYQNLVSDIIYYTSGEFSNRTASGTATIDQLFYNSNLEKPVMGQIIKVADIIAAYYEAKKSMDMGIVNDEISGAVVKIKESVDKEPVFDISLNGNNIKDILFSIIK